MSLRLSWFVIAANFHPLSRSLSTDSKDQPDWHWLFGSYPRSGRLQEWDLEGGVKIERLAADFNGFSGRGAQSKISTLMNAWDRLGILRVIAAEPRAANSVPNQ